MKKIKMPNWSLLISVFAEYTGDGLVFTETNYSELVLWFKENIEGKYLVDESDLVEVFGRKNKILSMNTYGDKTMEGDTHKAYLIESSIKPIKDILQVDDI